MDDRTKRGLIALNASLLVALGFVALAGPAGAQNQPGTRVRGEYTMVAGEMQGGNSSAIYIIDSANQELIALRWDESRRTLMGLGFRDIDADSKLKPGR